LLNQRKVNHRAATRSAPAALLAAAIGLISFDAPAVHAQSIMRTPNLNVGSRTPIITARINPNVAGRTTANTAAIAGRRGGIATTTGNITGRGTITNTNIANTAVGRTTTSAGTTAVRTTTSVTARVTPNVTATATPVITPRVAVVVPTLPYVRYSPNLYPACTYAYRGASGECSDRPISSVDLGGGGNASGPPPRSQNAGATRRGPRSIRVTSATRSSRKSTLRRPTNWRGVIA
jgi:hypothetical protein